MPAESLQVVRLAWFLSLGVLLSTFRDAWWLTSPRSGKSYLRAATRERIILGVIEILLVLAAAAIVLLGHGADSLTRWLGGGASGVSGTGGPGPASLATATPASPGTVATALPAALAILGVGLSFAGAILASTAKRALGAYFSVDLGVKEGHPLVTTGPYGLVRHPIYLGVLVFILGGGLVFDHGAVVLLAVALAPCFIAQARVEEGMFSAHFGPEHAAYRARVPAVLPWPRPGGPR
jgi:protein-S-isoprenylcysteine O-methyltransferase Ste14